MQTCFPRSCYDRVGGIVYFARMLDKIRQVAANTLPKEYHDNLGIGFDSRCCVLLGVKYEDLRKRTLEGGSDDEVLQWCFQHGHKPADHEIEIWNSFMLKRGWRDESTPTLHRRLKEAKLEHRMSEILTMFEFIDVDEDREPPKFA